MKIETNPSQLNSEIEILYKEIRKLRKGKKAKDDFDDYTFRKILLRFKKIYAKVKLLQKCADDEFLGVEAHIKLNKALARFNKLLVTERKNPRKVNNA